MSAEHDLLPLAQPQSPLFVGVDVGGTNIKIGLVDDAGRTLAFVSIPTEVPNGPDAAIARTAAAIDALIAEAGATREQVASLGLATPGSMDIPAGMMLTPHNLPTFFHYPVRDKLAAACRFPVVYNNDANAAAYGEFWVGSGRHAQSLLLLTLGTGVGGGIIIDGKVLDGHHSHGAECGHIIIDSRADALMCPCGKRGHLEAYASATAVKARAQSALDAGRESSLTQAVAGGKKLSAKRVYEQAQAGDALSLEIIDETARYLGIGITTLLHTIDPEAVALGGAMNFGGPGAELGERFIERVRREVRALAFGVLADQTAIDFATLGGDAGYLGAAGIAREAQLRK